MRWHVVLEYDGAPYVGWQRQARDRSVQGVLEAALAESFGEAPSVIGAGRTDAGVHALAQHAHFDLVRPYTADDILGALNYRLKRDGDRITVHAAFPTTSEFHARFHAHGRRYLYRIQVRAVPSILEVGRVLSLRHKPKLAPMQEAAAMLVGLHDFSSFRAAGCQAKTPLCRLDVLSVSECPLPLGGDAGVEIRFRAEGKSFLQRQVRILVGTLLLVGLGRREPAWAGAVLAARNRMEAGPTARAEGLYLAGVDYAAEYRQAT